MAALENTPRKLKDLRVVDLRRELENRGLDKNGVKAVLTERLQKVNLFFLLLTVLKIWSNI